MEKSDKVWVMPAKFGWSDLGSWNTLYNTVADPAANGNAVSVEGKSILKEVSGSVVFESDGRKLIAVSGLDDYMVIDTDRILLVCPRSDKRLQEVLSEIALPEYSEFK